MNEQSVHLLPWLAIQGAVLTTWGLMLLLLLLSLFLRHKLQQGDNPWRTLCETVYQMMENTVRDISPDSYRQITPFIASLWVFLILANLTGLIPGLHSPTADLSVTAALAMLVFGSVHWFGIRRLGLSAYLRHYLSPSPILLPFHLLSEVTRTLALALRLFGNIMSMEMAALLVLVVAGFLAPIPLLMLHIIEALVQAYIFGLLALLYIGSGLQGQGSAVAADHKQEP
ncbi:F0F1 ATP synthase subunit A [Shewanella sp. AS16]|uniref:F0F1 ATP synthase subunit A n=1 Tax=Shewanella sp. AS16 TaxID=2907625 RepID=UPI001F287403|nr:F0F1 ATP synthase subunit A [Shewanella sp. AS16]MCE9684801.1 F0F1 ATP synthase subunit A [Shewanella sp. AS16]